MRSPIEILDALADVGDLVDSLSEDLVVELRRDRVDTSTFTEGVLALRALKQRVSEFTKREETLRAECKRFEAELYDFMEHQRIEGHKVDGSNFVPAKTEFAQVQDIDAFAEWCEANDPSFLKTGVRADEVNKLVRARLDDGQPLPPGLGFYVRQYISVRAG